MKAITTLCLLFYNIIYSQLISTPKYSFEYLRFGSKKLDVQKNFLNVQPIPINDKVKSMMPKQDEEYITIMYRDTTLYKNAAIGLVFTKKDSLLSMVQYIIAAEKEEERVDVEKIAKTLWDETTNRFGIPTTDKDIPLFGKIRKWNMEKIMIVVVKTESEMKSITLTYKLK